MQPCYKPSNSFEVEMQLFVDLYVSATRKNWFYSSAEGGVADGTDVALSREGCDSLVKSFYRYVTNYKLFLSMHPRCP